MPLVSAGKTIITNYLATETNMTKAINNIKLCKTIITNYLATETLKGRKECDSEGVARPL